MCTHTCAHIEFCILSLVSNESNGCGGKVMGTLGHHSCSINACWSWLYMAVSTSCSTPIITFLSENKKYFMNVPSRASKVIWDPKLCDKGVINETFWIFLIFYSWKCLPFYTNWGRVCDCKSRYKSVHFWAEYSKTKFYLAKPASLS